MKKNKAPKEVMGNGGGGGSGGPPQPHPAHFQPHPLDFTGLQILSKAEWKKLRNTYLNLQRKNMAQV